DRTSLRLAHVAVGTCVSSHAPRTEPYVRLSFFSSRRRHTTSKCDWSSDVSSSDLIRLCARHVLCWPAFPLVPALRSIDSAAADSAADCSAAGRHVVRRQSLCTLRLSRSNGQHGASSVL